MSTARAAQVVDPDAARRDAHHILSDRRFHPSPTPRPLRGPLQWLGDRLSTLFDWIARVLSPVPGVVWLIVALAIVAAIVARIVTTARSRHVTPAPGGRRYPIGDDDDREDADALDRAAGAAERAGDLEHAVRLRFRAGLLRLGDRGAITYRPSVTTREVRRALDSDTFDGLAGTFEEVTYGGRAAELPDIAAARREWPRVLDEAGRR